MDSNNYHESFIYMIRYGKAVITGYQNIEEDSVIEIPEQIHGYPVIAVAENAFAHCPMRCVICPEGMTEIGYKAFQSCPRLLDVFLPSTLVTIGDSAFAYCPFLRLIVLEGNALTYLGICRGQRI